MTTTNAHLHLATRRRCWQWLGACGVAWVLPACASLDEPLQVNVVGMESLPGEGMELRLAVKLRIQNPNDSPIEFDGVSLSLEVRDATFATGVSPEKGVVPRFGEAVIVVPMSISAVSAVRQLFGLAMSKDKSGPTEYTMYGRLSGAFGGASFEKTGVIDFNELMKSK